MRVFGVMVWWVVLAGGVAAAGDAPLGPEMRVWRSRAAETSPARGPRGVLGADDPLLQALAGARGGNRLVVCGGCRRRTSTGGPCLPQRCAAVAWRQRWALARASCLYGVALEDMRVLRTAQHERTCDALEHAPQMLKERTRQVVRGAAPVRCPHAGGGYDAALLELDRPLARAEPLANSTAADITLQDIKYWMEQVEGDYWSRKSEEMQKYEGNMAYTLFMVGILPTAMFFVFFLFIIFCSGTPARVPYTNEKEGIQTPWMIHGYSSDIKCFPTYGQV